MRQPAESPKDRRRRRRRGVEIPAEPVTRNGAVIAYSHVEIEIDPATGVPRLMIVEGERPADPP